MKHSKHLKEGMSFIEVVAAITILAIFGSSIFLMQTYLFERIIISQRKLSATLRMQKELVAYRLEILKELLAHKGPIEESLKEKSKQFSDPDMMIAIKTHSDFKNTKFKDYKDLYLITAQAKHQEQEYAALYTFIYIPKVPKK